MKYPLKGKCQCGQVAYEIGKPFIAQLACHCSECQKLSATSFSISALVDRKDFKLLSGELKVYMRIADSGLTNACYFCPDCGNRIYHENPDKPDIIRLKPGTLEDTSVIQPTIHVWLKSKQGWVEIPKGVETYETQPVL